MGLIKFAVKSSILGGVIYYTVEEGLWSSPKESIDFYRRTYDLVAPYIKDNVPTEVSNQVAELPSLSTMTGCAKGMWNRGVKTSIKYISESPSHISNGVDQLIAMVNQQSSPAETPKAGKP